MYHNNNSNDDNNRVQVYLLKARFSHSFGVSVRRAKKSRSTLKVQPTNV